MREDFVFVKNISVDLSKRAARRRAKKVGLTGAMAATLVLGAWQPGLVLFGLLTVTNIVQKTIGRIVK
ncbi:hypothetical protein [Enterococcus sp. AZ109]|uniref:hypothetical protein n=1 Tax=Enterococcus sp. AZ109 TaxID=2774634 RepID=UPI003F211804